MARISFLRSPRKGLVECTVRKIKKIEERVARLLTPVPYFVLKCTVVKCV